MKKSNKISTGLKITKAKILVLSTQQMENIAAGDDTSLQTRPGSFECIPPYNAPPLLTQKFCN